MKKLGKKTNGNRPTLIRFSHDKDKELLLYDNIDLPNGVQII